MAEANKFEIKFGTDGWRGVIAGDFTFANVAVVACAIAEYIKSAEGSGPGARAIVGYDNRFLSEKFAEKVARVLAGCGVKASVSSTAATSPSVSLYCKQNDVYGVMITASHNPPSWNGIKIKLQYGGSVSEKVIGGVSSFLGKSAVKEFTGEIVSENILAGYKKYLKSLVGVKAKPGLRVVVDPMNGSGAGIFDTLLNQGVFTIRNYRDPLFSGFNPEPIEQNLSPLKKEVLRVKAAAGFAFDGDADRIGVIDDNGRYLPPHIVFPLLLKYLAGPKGLSGKVVQTISLGYLSERIAKKYSLPFEEVPVGFKHICPRMLDGDVLLGGEESGGYGWKGGLPERDWILNALLIYEMLSKTDKKLSSLVDDMQREFGKSCFVRRDVKLSSPVNKADFTKTVYDTIGCLKKVREVRTYDGIKIIFEDDRWLLMRPSGTEPVLRTYSETPSAKESGALLDFALKVVKNYTGVRLYGRISQSEFKKNQEA